MKRVLRIAYVIFLFTVIIPFSGLAMVFGGTLLVVGYFLVNTGLQIVKDPRLLSFMEKADVMVLWSVGLTSLLIGFVISIASTFLPFLSGKMVWQEIKD